MASSGRRTIQVRDASTEICVQECGGKCCHAPGHFSLQRNELVRLHYFAEQLGVQFTVYQHDDHPDWFEADHLTNGGMCPFLDDAAGMCRIYEHRPEACKRFPENYQPRCLLFEEVP